MCCPLDMRLDCDAGARGRLAKPLFISSPALFNPLNVLCSADAGVFLHKEEDKMWGSGTNPVCNYLWGDQTCSSEGSLEGEWVATFTCTTAFEMPTTRPSPLHALCQTSHLQHMSFL